MAIMKVKCTQTNYDVSDSDKCVYLLSLTSDTYWVELDFINNCKELQL